jgi:hypothetical protein
MEYEHLMDNENLDDRNIDNHHFVNENHQLVRTRIKKICPVDFFFSERFKELTKALRSHTAEFA